MSAARIDFAPRRSVLPLLRRVLALLALAACAASLERWFDYTAQADAWAREQDAAEAVVPADAAPADGEDTAAALRQLGAARTALDAPWTPLLRGLEAVPLGDVALLNLSADAAAGTLNIEAEARDAQAMQGYLAALGNSAGLRRVHLIALQNGATPGKPGLRFTVQADWPAAAQGTAGKDR